MVDFSIGPFKEMVKLNMIVNSFLWIDHHKTAINHAKKFKNVLDCLNGFEKVVSINFAACELAWKYFYKISANIEFHDIPIGVKLLGRYDVWDLKADERILPFQMGMLSYDTSVDSSIWSKIFFPHDDKFIDQTVKMGERIRSYVSGKNKWNMKFSFPFEFEGVKFICINNVTTGSHQFDSVWDPEKYDAMMVFYREPNKKWAIHIYTPKTEIDLSPIASKYGGGGHSNACGFKLDKLPF